MKLYTNINDRLSSGCLAARCYLLAMKRSCCMYASHYRSVMLRWCRPILRIRQRYCLSTFGCVILGGTNDISVFIRALPLVHRLETGLRSSISGTLVSGEVYRVTQVAIKCLIWWHVARSQFKSLRVFKVLAHDLIRKDKPHRRYGFLTLSSIPQTPYPFSSWTKKLIFWIASLRLIQTNCCVIHLL